MPEGDVVRRTAHRLDQALSDRRLVRAELRWPSVAGVELVGRSVLGTSAYGKHLLTRLDDGRTLHTHLRMDGSWSISRTGTPGAAGRGPFIRVVLGNALWTATGDRLGMVDVLDTRDEPRLLGRLGPDLLADDFIDAGLERALLAMRREPARAVCDALLDQSVVAGIGTIFAAESLFAERVWPWTPSGGVPSPRGLLLTARRLMVGSLEKPWHPRGTDPRGLPAVHGRASRPCRRCGTPISVGTSGVPPRQRPIFFCVSCQVSGRRGAVGGASSTR
jgi:endonuclease-8